MKDQRRKFISMIQSGEASFSEICEEFGISRPTGYKWWRRFQTEGDDGLVDRDSVRHTQKQKTCKQVESKIIEVKNRYPSWGPKKIYAYLNREDPGENWPSSTTVGNILKRHGLVTKRKFRRRFPARTDPLSHCEKPNDVWCADFKGWFKTKDNIKCDPFTVTDGDSRYILFCSKLHSGKVEDVWDSLEELFRKFGLPKYLRTDNGPPFASSGAGRLSGLSVKLVKAGVTPEWIDPGKPHQNGRHERMHGTLQSEGSFPLKLTLEEQQMKFEEFLLYFNTERPHEALGQHTPSEVYVPSKRHWDGKLKSPVYGPEYTVKRVHKRGQFSWKGKLSFVGKALANEEIGVKESSEGGHWEVYFGPIFLGTLDPLGRFTTVRAPARDRRKYTERCY